MNKKYYRPDIDGLRALAVLSVVAFHVAPGRIPSGFIGVDIFFVISGFLITKIILLNIKSNNFSFLNFYTRRIKRIFPSLITILISIFFLGFIVLTNNELLHLCKHILGGSLFVSNFFLLNEGDYFDINSNSKLLLHLWSLSIEEQFYIVWPFIVFMIFKSKYNPLIVFLILFLISFSYNIFYLNNNLLIFYSPISRFWELLIGAILAFIIINKKNNFNLFHLNLINIIGFSLLVLGYIFIDAEKNFPGWYALLPCVGTFMIIYSGQSTLINKYILSNNFIVWVGLISFPLYLWHWPLLTFARILEGTEISQYLRIVIVFISILLSWLTYKYIENPIRYGEKSLRFLLIAILMLIFISAFGYLFKGFDNRFFSPKILNEGDLGHERFFNHITNNYYKCTPDQIYLESSNWKKTKRCFQSANTNKIDIAIIGDSHAEHLFPGLAKNLKDLNIVFYGGIGEPFLQNQNFDKIYNFVLNDPNIKDLILISNWRSLLNANNFENFYNNLSDTSEKLSLKNKKVYISNDVPNFKFNPSKCKYVNRFIFENFCTQVYNESDLFYLEKFKEFKENKNLPITFIDTYNLFCNNSECSMAKNNELFYRDDNHLNINGSFFVGQKFLYEIKKN